MTYVTLDQILATPRCREYPESRVRELAAARTESRVRELAEIEIPIADRIWLLIHLMDARTQRLFACACAERALTGEREAGREPDARLWHAVEVARAYARGEATYEELWAARAAGRAARVAEDAAAWAAARAAEDAAAWAAARAAARAAGATAGAREWQLDRAVEMLEAM